MSNKNIFKTDFNNERVSLDPEAIFRDLKDRAPEIKHLWSQQADILREYYNENKETKDLAIELPTGTGKTLIGLLIAEYRQREFNDRVAYVCPTRQLAKQVSSKAIEYGIKGYSFVGKQKDYDVSKFSEYQEGKAIAITTYSGIFNNAPRIKDPNTIIFDDAHASENYMINMWALEIDRLDNGELYNAVLSLYKNSISQSFVRSLSEDSPDQFGNVTVVPGKWFRSKYSALDDLLESHLNEGDSGWYAWQMIKHHLAACNLYIGNNIILLRPITPPTLTHEPFRNADQRVYMSATLGKGGELERITGVKKIERVTIPSGWETRGIGRRLFLVPQRSLKEKDAQDVMVQAAAEIDRSLVLVPNQNKLNKYQDILQSAGIKIIGASDIEDSIEQFENSSGTALLMSRYDGLDLPDDTCRLLILGDLPAGINLQEQFFFSRLRASSMIRNRILTRFMQGVGRCTRSDNDYSVVFLMGRNLVDFILKKDNRKMLNQELQAELEFGIVNSTNKSSEEFEDLWKVFLQHGDDWNEAEKSIVGLRENKEQSSDIIMERLGKIVSDEVDYLYALWKGDYEGALEKAKSVADLLEGEETKGYRGWWYYLAGDAALMIHEETTDAMILESAKDLFRRAGKCVLANSWLMRLPKILGDNRDKADMNTIDPIAVETILSHLIGLGLNGKKFEDEMTKLLSLINSDKHDDFQNGLKSLGIMLGFNSTMPKGLATPDCVWSITDQLHIAHEVKTEHSENDPIGVKDIRQTEGHIDWIKSNLNCKEHTDFLAVIESPRTKILKESLPHAKTLFKVSPDEIRKLAIEIIERLRLIRSQSDSMGDEGILENIMLKYREQNLLPANIVERLSIQKVSDMPTG